MTGVPKPGAFIHVFIEPFIADGEVKFLNQNGELRVEVSKRGQDFMEELDGHEVVMGKETAMEIVEALVEQGIEAINGRSSGGSA